MPRSRWPMRFGAVVLGLLLSLLVVWFTRPLPQPMEPWGRVFGSVNVSLTRTHAGLLARRIAADSLVPFSASEWTDKTGVTISVDGNGRLSLVMDSSVAWGGAQSEMAPSRTKRMVQILARTDAQSWFGPAVADAGGSTATFMGAASSVDRSPEATLLQSVSAGTSTNHVLTSTGVDKDTGIDYRVSVFHDGTSLSGYDFDSDTSTGPTTGNRSSGFAGITVTRSSQTTLVSEFYDMADRYLVVTGLSSGQIVRVRDSGGNTLAEATESGGTATIDLFEIDISATFDIAIYESDGTTLVEVGTPEDGVIAGGDEWQLFSSAEFPETDGVWSWWGDPRAIRHVGTYDRTYFGAIQANGDVVVRSYDHDTGEIAGAVLFADLEIDDHDIPALRIRSDGRIQAFWSRHSGSTIYHRLSTNAEDVTAWDSLQTLTTDGTFTYPSPLDLSDRVVLHWRKNTSSPQYQYYRESEDDGATWDTPVQLTAAHAPYMKFAVHPTVTDRVDYFVSNNHPRSGDPTLYHFYRLGSSFFKSDGTSSGATPLDFSDMTVVWDASAEGDGGWQWDINYDADGNPVVLFATFPSTSNHRLQHGRWTGSAWVINEVVGMGGSIAESTTPQAEDHYSAGAALDPEDPTRIWVGIRASATVSSLWEYFTQDEGATWTGVERTPDTTVENVRPFVPRNRSDDLAVLFLRGSYPNYTTYETTIAGLHAGPAPTPGATPGDTPSLSLVDKGHDYIEVEISAYNHTDGEVEPSAFDPDDPKPWHQLSEIQLRLGSSSDWSAPLDTVTVTYTEDVESRRVRFEGLTAGTSYKFRGRQLDGYLAVYTAYSSDLTQSTDAAPANAPLKPAVSITCGRSIVMTGDAYQHASMGAGTAHAKTQARICYGGKCQTHTVSSPVETFTFPDNPPGSASVYLRYGDDSTPTRWGPWSDADVCAVPDYPPAPQFTAPAALVVATSTVIQWTYSDPNEVGWTSDIERASGTDDFVTIATDQVAQSTTFTITGLPNGDYTYRVRARNPTTDETGEWGYLPLVLDRTETRFFHKTASDLAGADGRQIWDGAAHVSWTGLPGEGLFASRVHTGSTVRRSGYVFDDWGEPDEFDLIVRMEHIPKECDWYWRFANAGQTKGGAMASGVDGDPGTRSGRQTLYDVGIQPWYLGGPNALCFSTNVRNEGLALTARRAITHPGNVWRYGQSYNRGSLRTVTARNGTGTYSHSSAVLPSGSSPAISGPAVNVADGEGGEVRQPVTLFLRVRRSVQGGHTGRTFQARFMGAGIGHSDWHQTAFVRDTDDQGRTIPCGPCGLAFQDMDTIGVGRSEGILFTSVTLRVVEYGSCEASEDLLVGCEADWDFTLFENDDVTPWFGTYSGTYRDGSVGEADFYSTRECPRPLLKVPSNFSETEIDYAAGASRIGQITVEVVDKRLTQDQDTGIVSSRIAEAMGRRAVLRRWREDLGMVTVFDGVVNNWSLQDNGPGLVSYKFHCRDPREREREIELFGRNETFSLWPQSGPIEAYGQLPNNLGYLVPPAEIGQATFSRETPGGGEDGIHYGFITLTVIDAALGGLEDTVVPWGEPTLDVEANLWRYRDITVRWRPATGGDWTYLRDMPTRYYRNAISHPEDPSPSTPAFFWQLYMGSVTSGDIPNDTTLIDYQILAAKTSETTPFFWDQGTFGELLLAVYEGDFSKVPPRIRYNEDEITAFGENTPRARFIVYEPAPNLREWVQQHIFAPIGYAPSFDERMRIVPSRWTLPPADVDLVHLDVDWIIPDGGFEHSTDSVVNHVRYTYIRESLEQDEEISSFADFVNNLARIAYREIYGDLPWTRLVEQKVTREYIHGDPEADPNNSSVHVIGDKLIEYKPVTVREFAGSLALGLPPGSMLTQQAAGPIADGIGINAISRYGWGAAEYECYVRSGMAHGPTFDPYTLDLKVGDWVKAEVPWLPEFSLGQRNLYRYMQITSVSDVNIGRRRLRLSDGGPVVLGGDGESDEGEEVLLDPPAIGTLAEVDLTVEVPITLPVGAPAGYSARVEAAVSIAEPSAVSGLWTLVGYLTADGSVFTAEYSAGDTIWVRARGEVTEMRPSAWAPAESITLGDTPALLALAAELLDGGLVQLTWTPNAFAGGLEVEVSTGVIGHTPTFGAFDEVDADDETLNLTGEEISYGEELYYRLTTWETFSLGSVGGTEGLEYVGRIQRTDPTTTADHALGDHTDTDFIPPEERVDGMVPMWTIDESGNVEDFTLRTVPSLPIDLATDVTGVLPTANGGVPTGGTTGQVLKKQSNADHDADWDDDDTGASGSLVWTTAVRTAGNVAVGTTWAAVDTGIDITLPAATGDQIEVMISAAWAAQSTDADSTLDVATMVGGSANSWFGLSGGFGSSSGVGPPGWYLQEASRSSIAGSWVKTLVAGDISGGNVTLRVAARRGANARSLLADTSIPFQWAARNLGQ